MNIPVRSLYVPSAEARLAEIERALCRPLPRDERRALIREYLDMTEPKTSEAAKE